MHRLRKRVVYLCEHTPISCGRARREGWKEVPNDRVCQPRRRRALVVFFFLFWGPTVSYSLTIKKTTKKKKAREEPRREDLVENLSGGEGADSTYRPPACPPPKTKLTLLL